MSSSSNCPSLQNARWRVRSWIQNLLGVCVITNKSHLLICLFLIYRPGRLEVQIEISLPDENGRLQILQIHTNKMKESSFPLSAVRNVKNCWALHTGKISVAPRGSEGGIMKMTGFVLAVEQLSASVHPQPIDWYAATCLTWKFSAQ